MAINKKLIHFNNKAAFDRELKAGNILDKSIVFIKDSQEIYTHGLLYSCNKSEIEQLINQLTADSVELGTFAIAEGTTEEELTPTTSDTVSVAIGKLLKVILDNKEVTSEAIVNLFKKVNKHEREITEINIKMNQLPKNVIIYGVEKERSSNNPDFTTFINEAYKSTLPLHNNNFRPCLIKANTSEGDTIATPVCWLNPINPTAEDIDGNDISSVFTTGIYNGEEVDFAVYCNGAWIIRGGTDETYERYLVGNSWFRYGNDTARYYKGFYRSADICTLIDNKLRCFQSTNTAYGTKGGATAGQAGFAKTELNRYQYEIYANNKNAKGTNIFKNFLITDFEYLDAFMVIEFGTFNFMGIFGMTAAPSPANNWNTYNGNRPIIKILDPLVELGKKVRGEECNPNTTNSIKPASIISESAVTHEDHLTGKAYFKITYTPTGKDPIVTQFPVMVYRGITNITKHIWNCISGLEVFANEDNSFSMYIQRDADKVKIGGDNNDLSAAQDYDMVFENQTYGYGYSLDLAQRNQDPNTTIYGMRRGGGLTTGQCAHVWTQNYHNYRVKRRCIRLSGNVGNEWSSPRNTDSSGDPSGAFTSVGCGFHAKAE